MLDSRGGSPAPGTGEQTFNINRNNSTGTGFVLLTEYSGGSQDNTGVSGAAKIVLTAGGYNNGFYIGSCPINFRFSAHEEIRIQRTGGSADYNKLIAYLYVEFD